MKTILIIFGGNSTEYEVSLRSAVCVISNIPNDKYKVITLGITRDGKWLLFDGDVSLIAEDKWHSGEYCVPAIISPDRNEKNLVIFNDGSVTRQSFDVVFPVLHGKNGEDGVIQGLFELAGVPYVGCNLLSSALCMDKVFTNTLADSLGIRQAKWLSSKHSEYEKNADSFVDEAVSYLGFPIFVKPANAGSSVGISKTKDLAGLRRAIDDAFIHDTKVLLEEGIDGREMECAVLGNDEPTASVVGEIIPSNEFYDYSAKYIDGASELIVPANISEAKSDEIGMTAVKIFKALGCSGLSRVDFFVGKADDAVYFNEINTIPGFTSISMYPKLFAELGVTYPELLDALILLAFDKASA